MPPWRVCWSSVHSCPVQDVGLKAISHVGMQRGGSLSQYGFTVLLGSRTLGVESPLLPLHTLLSSAYQEIHPGPRYICSYLQAMKAVLASQGWTVTLPYSKTENPSNFSCHALSSIFHWPLPGAICIPCPSHYYGISYEGYHRQVTLALSPNILLPNLVYLGSYRYCETHLDFQPHTSE